MVDKLRRVNVMRLRQLVAVELIEYRAHEVIPPGDPPAPDTPTRAASACCRSRPCSRSCCLLSMGRLSIRVCDVESLLCDVAESARRLAAPRIFEPIRHHGVSAMGHEDDGLATTRVTASSRRPFPGPLRSGTDFAGFGGVDRLKGLYSSLPVRSRVLELPCNCSPSNSRPENFQGS